jgi:hypothetical protein
VPDPPSGLTAVDPRLWMRIWLRVKADPSVKNTGSTLAALADYKTGARIHPGTELLMLITGIKGDKTVRSALSQIREWGLIWRYAEASKAEYIVTKKGVRVKPSDEYRLTFPADQTGIPMLSPDMEDGWEACG